MLARARRPGPEFPNPGPNADLGRSRIAGSGRGARAVRPYGSGSGARRRSRGGFGKLLGSRARVVKRAGPGGFAAGAAPW